MAFWISMDQLRVGLFVQIDMPWLQHPFSFNSFKIKTEHQIRALQQLGLQKIRYDPDRSGVAPLPATIRPTPAEPQPSPASGRPAVREKQARVEYLKQYRDAVAGVEAALIDAARTLHGIHAKVATVPDGARAEA
jgi:hypothetical protein